MCNQLVESTTLGWRRYVRPCTGVCQRRIRIRLHARSPRSRKQRILEGAIGQPRTIEMLRNLEESNRPDSLEPARDPFVRTTQSHRIDGLACRTRNRAMHEAERRPGLPVLFVSGYVDSAQRERVLRLQPRSRFLAKPFGIDELAEAVTETMTLGRPTEVRRAVSPA